ncbi:glycosyltransferase [Klebsiella michiganensis]|uniref:glycosyltransferase family 2 protein n=1 Tax=Klebsiella michiganensis TaxID=1134687 RepID=UPI0015A706CB|nr:glycosyltransferase [Klebsiella michiganensis]MBZ7142684.1 glycosyltransferase [Klebsiella michiganensis]MBZ7581334.1 glycosyltransferase [Klebsiella michiganensis]
MYSQMPLVSVYITTCNRLDKLKRAVRSVQEQAFENIEILICDDASTDGTEKYVQELIREDNRIRYFRNQTSKGACAARNLGIFNAKGQYITGLDDDDEFLPLRISKFLEVWDSKYSFICCDFIERFAEGKTKKYYNSKNITKFTYVNMLFENVASNQIFTLTERLKTIDGFDVRARRLQDWDTWLRLSYRFGDFIRLPIATYIMHHDHAMDEKRVSKSYPLSSSLIDLRDRNMEIYTDKHLEFMNFIISTEEKKARPLDSFIWSVRKKTPKYIIKYALQSFLYNK